MKRKRPGGLQLTDLGYVSIPRGDPFAKAYTLGQCRILVAKEGGKLHLSISHPKRLPTWDELKHARYELCPNDMHVAMMLPPKEEFINIHEYCFHLWEI